MIAVAYIFIVCLAWFLALTIGLPLYSLLLFSKSFRASFFAWLYCRVIDPLFKNQVDASRKAAFQLLKDSLKDKTGPFEVLEVGAGPGPNLQFYPENCNLTVLDKNESFNPYFLQNLKKYSHITYRRTVNQYAENMTEIPDASYDVVISTLLHCSVDDSNAVLREIKRVLKPGGKYLFLDHVAFPKGDIGLYIQWFMSPLWYLSANGCIMHRDVAKIIKGAGFSDVKINKLVYDNFFVYFAKHRIAGIATK